MHLRFFVLGHVINNLENEIQAKTKFRKHS